MFPFAGNSPLTTAQLFGTPGPQSAYKDMSFSPFFSPNVFGLDSIRFTPGRMTPAQQQLLTPAELSYSIGSLSSSSAIKFDPASMSSAKGNRSKDPTGPSPRVVFKDQLVQPSSAQSANSNGKVSIW